MNLNLRKAISITILAAFWANIVGLCPGYAQEDFRLPAPGVMVHLSPEFNPPVLKGVTVYPNDPFKFDFIIHQGDEKLGINQKQREYTKLIKYFL